MDIMKRFLYFFGGRWCGRKRFYKGRGMRVHMAPSALVRLRESVKVRAKALQELYEQVYYSCDNFPKHAGKLSGYLSESYREGKLRDLAADLAFSADLAEGGALSRMGAEYGLTDIEQRTCCFIYLGFTWQQTCTAELISENAYNVRCSRVRKKLGLDKDDRIRDFIAAYCSSHSTASGL